MTNGIKMLNSLAACASLVVIFLFVSASNSIAFADDTFQTPSNIEPTLLSYKLSFFWPMGHCQTQNSGCKKKAQSSWPDHFTLHGLWPIYKGKCTDSTEKFDMSKIIEVKDLKDNMEKYWPNLKTYEQTEEYQTFWSREWKVHGKKCNLFTVSGYFEQSVKLLQDSNVLTILQEAGMPTKPENVKKAFQGKVPSVVCRKDKNGKSYLSELEFCLDSSLNYKDHCESETSPCPVGEDFSYGGPTLMLLANATSSLPA